VVAKHVKPHERLQIVIACEREREREREREKETMDEPIDMPDESDPSAD